MYYTQVLDFLSKRTTRVMDLFRTWDLNGDGQSHSHAPTADPRGPPVRLCTPHAENRCTARVPQATA